VLNHIFVVYFAEAFSTVLLGLPRRNSLTSRQGRGREYRSLKLEKPFLRRTGDFFKVEMAVFTVCSLMRDTCHDRGSFWVNISIRTNESPTSGTLGHRSRDHRLREGGGRGACPGAETVRVRNPCSFAPPPSVRKSSVRAGRLH